ncbi:hypothetical protein D3C85_1838790 [compost metagenome]
MVEQALLKKTRLQVRKQADGKIDRAVLQTFRQGIGVVAQRTDRTTRSAFSQSIH